MKQASAVESAFRAERNLIYYQLKLPPCFPSTRLYLIANHLSTKVSLLWQLGCKDPLIVRYLVLFFLDSQNSEQKFKQLTFLLFGIN